MFESDTYYHPRLDLWPKVLLRWATALTEYPQSWTCLNIRHVDSLRLGNPLFLLRHHSYTVGSGLCITPIQTLAETPYCLNKWVRLAFICQENWGGAVRTRSLVHVHVGVPPSSERGGGLKTCQNSSRFNSNVDDENTLQFHHGSLRRTDMFYQLRVRGFLLGRFIFSACKLCAPSWLLLLGTREDPDREDTFDTVILN